RGANNPPPSPPPPHPHPTRPHAKPPAGSRSARSPSPAAPKTTAGAAHTTAAPRQDAQPLATQVAPLPHPPTDQPAQLPSAPRTGCGSKPQHQGSNGCAWSDARPPPNDPQPQTKHPHSQPAPIRPHRQTARTATPHADCARIAQRKPDPAAQAAPRGQASRSPSAAGDPIQRSLTAPCSREAAPQHAHATPPHPLANQ